ncbi:MAG: NADH-quinone oxidoreductase subunit L [Candidatus Omnitrophica bacterium]|nr:NADH-quinone oxidoreductase subunit L [Candidatus Omnitrophota bacterium]
MDAAHAHAIAPFATRAPQLFWIPGLPLIAFVILILVGRRLGRLAAVLSVAALAGAFVLTARLAGAVLGGQRLAVEWAWLSAGDPRWTMGFAVDGLSWLMLAVVTSIGTMIQCYSIGYMHGDPRFSRFFAYLSLFCASMLGLVLADHLALLYVCWELVGLCSYLLISFWFEKPEAAAAGRKAFLTTRVGDAGLFLGMLLLFVTTGQLHFERFGAIAAQLHGQPLLTWISLLIFMGAMGKSAQMPLHVWLPDAMEGPTPVSALIHAATMVAAGVYLIARSLPLFTPQSLAVVLGIGLATHLFAGTVALTMTDIKRVLAYSTISQLGLMFVALGLGSMPLAMFHLTTHAFFKALLFLGAGSVIHGTHQQDLSRLGGLFRLMPVTGATFLVAAAAMSGIPPLSGFWSKDAILIEAQAHHPWLLVVLCCSAVMSAAYIFRLYLRCFHAPAAAPAAGSPKPHSAAHGGHGAQTHESPPIMTVPLMALAIGAALVGLLGSPVAHHWFFRALGIHELHEEFHWHMVVVSLAIAGVGIALAWFIGVQRRQLLPEALRPLGRALYTAAAGKYWVDELYGAIIIRPFLRLTQRLAAFDLGAIDGLVNRTGAAGWSVGQWQSVFDQQVVDRVVNGVAALARELGRAGRRLQTGVVHHYLLVIGAAVVVLSVWLRWR